MTPHDDAAERIALSDLARASDATRHYKERGYGLIPGTTRRLLDLGCGTGDDALAMAELLSDRSWVVGVDAHEALVEEAHRRARNVALGVQFRRADASALPFEDGFFDVVRADFVLSELPAQGPALHELARVLAPGGLLLVHDAAGAPLLCAPFTALTRAGFEAARALDRFALSDGTRGLTLTALRGRP